MGAGGPIQAALDLVATLPLDDRLLVAAIVLARLAIPLLIPRAPLIILAALVLDAADQTILQTFTALDTSETGPYQGFDKALDIYYLAIAYMAMLRNWTSDAAVRIGQALFIYRLVGVTLFELTDTRALLLVFPNTFEYYFIAFEAWRLWRDPSRRTARFWLLAALGIWVLIKLPQEYWIHVAQLDTTDVVRAHPWVGVVGLLGIAALTAIFLLWVRPRLPAPDWSLRLTADPIPTSIAETRQRHALLLERGGFAWWEIAEKGLGLLSLIVIIFAEIIPGVDVAPRDVFIGVTAVVIANTAISHWVARQGGTRFGSSTFVAFPLFVLINLGFVVLAWFLLDNSGDEFSLGNGLFFAYLIAIVIWLYDRYKPVHDVRFADSPLRVTGLGDFVERVRTPRP
ncbi:MAG: hypothetical protein ACRC50_10190 [Gaiella sp.]